MPNSYWCMSALLRSDAESARSAVFTFFLLANGGGGPRAGTPPPARCRDVGLRPARRCAIHGARDVAGLITLVAPDVPRHPLCHHACGGRCWTRVLCLVSLQVATQLVVVLGITPSLVAELTMQVPRASVLPRLVGLSWVGRLLLDGLTLTPPRRGCASPSTHGLLLFLNGAFCPLQALLQSLYYAQLRVGAGVH